ncbi:MAG: DoxX family protein [Ignavibacteriaceae bacterium]
MNAVLKLESWADRHHPKWIDILRVVLGIIFIIKGIALIEHREEVIMMMEKSNIDLFTFSLSSQYVIAFDLAGGLFIAIGLLTRLIVFFQLPVVILSIIFIDYHQNLFALNSELGYLILILALVIFFLFYGSGHVSVDNYISKRKEK